MLSLVIHPKILKTMSVKELYKHIHRMSILHNQHLRQPRSSFMGEYIHCDIVIQWIPLNNLKIFAVLNII